MLSSYENIELAERVLTELCGANKVDDEVTYWAGMALREALANAIKHGNKLNPEKRVYVHMVLRPGTDLRIEIEDEGNGFDAGRLADPTAPANLLRSNGRGVYYMRQFMDEVRFHTGKRGGTLLELVKRLNASPGRVT